MAMRVYIADLRYNYSGVVANDCMPLGVAYMKAVMDREDPTGDRINSRLFAYPDRLIESIKQAPPDVLMLSNYVWNEALSHFLFRVAKAVNPNVLTVMGGPNISIEPERQIEFVQKRPWLDVYALGEADFLAYDIVSLFENAAMSHKKFGSIEVPSSVYRNGDGEVVRSTAKPRHKEVDEIPSPWLTGIQDEFFDGKLAPMIETNRGCPFTCTFCVQGTNFYTKVHNFSVDRMKEEIHYVARKIKQLSPKMGTLRIADSNYGMFERDIEISAYIGQMQRDYSWPTFIDATTGKNRADRIIKSVEQVSGALVLYQAVQSLDENVLRKVKRQTIKLDAYKQLEVHMRGRGLKSVSDLILGLPGESLQTHLHGLHSLLDSNINQMHNFQAMMLKGSEMEGVQAREEFKFGTRFRILPKNSGIYDDEKVFDTEEIIVSTDTLPFDDYVTCRKWHMTSSVFWNDGWFEPVVRFVRAHGIRNSDWWSRMLPAMENGSPAVQAFLNSFVKETCNELFDTREACIKFYENDENFRRLQSGEIGDNLMYRYRAIASFHEWDDVCSTAMKATRELLEERGIADKIDNFDQFWDDFTAFIRHQHAAGRTEAEILSNAFVEMNYDIPGWLAQGDYGDPNVFRLAEPEEFEFRYSEEGLREMDAALSTWGTEVKGLSKLVTRIKLDWQVRSCVRKGAAEPEMVLQAV
jgi:radical SAM superfamily enzyme YgiQ (UPF0313 family)